MAKPDNDSSFGLDREILKGSITADRPIPNYYGTKYTDSLTIPFFFIKNFCDTSESEITKDEIRLLQSWLTSAKVPKPLRVETEEHDYIEYRGLFNNPTPWEVDGLRGIYISFVCDSVYAYQYRYMKVECTDETTRNFLCDTDELYDSVYPVVRIKPNEAGTFSIENINESSTMTFTFSSKYEEVFIDCRNDRVIADGKTMSLADIGFDMEELLDYNNVNSGIYKIYWLRFLAGNNKLRFKGNGTFIIECRVPVKIGGV
jgi:phage-related protein